MAKEKVVTKEDNSEKTKKDKKKEPEYEMQTYASKETKPKENTNFFIIPKSKKEKAKLSVS